MDKQPYPWKLNAEELSPLKGATAKRAAFKKPPAKSRQGILLSLGGISVITALLWGQGQWVQANQVYTLPEKPPQLTGSIQIVPSPSRYELWAKEQLDKPRADVGNESPDEPKLDALIQISNTAPTTASSTFTPENFTAIPPEPEKPSFELIGIAKGTDGTVATLRVHEGNTQEVKDIRQGEPVIAGYQVTRIAEEYVLISNPKEGETIRVD